MMWWACPLRHSLGCEVGLVFLSCLSDFVSWVFTPVFNAYSQERTPRKTKPTKAFHVKLGLVFVWQLEITVLVAHFCQTLLGMVPEASLDDAALSKRWQLTMKGKCMTDIFHPLSSPGIMVSTTSHLLCILWYADKFQFSNVDFFVDLKQHNQGGQEQHVFQFHPHTYIDQASSTITPTSMSIG